MTGTHRTGRRTAAVPAIDLIAEMDSSTAQTLIYILKPALTVYTLLMIVRIVMTWSPEVRKPQNSSLDVLPTSHSCPGPCVLRYFVIQLSGEEFPWSVAYKSTEGLLDPTRKVIKPFNGLDVSPIVWVALLSFMSEVRTGIRAQVLSRPGHSIVHLSARSFTGPDGAARAAESYREKRHLAATVKKES